MARLRKMNHLIQHDMDDEVLVYDPVVDRTHRLNVSASRIWELCDGTRSLEEIARVLTEQFEVEFVIDQKNVLGSVFGYRAIPNGVFSTRRRAESPRPAPVQGSSGSARAQLQGSRAFA